MPSLCPQCGFVLPRKPDPECPACGWQEEALKQPTPASEVGILGEPIEVPQIGTVELLRTRVFLLDPLSRVQGLEAVVEPQVCPLMLYEGQRFWVMRGHINAKSVPSLTAHEIQQLKGFEVSFPSRSFDETQWRELRNTVATRQGDSDQFLRIREEKKR